MNPPTIPLSRLRGPSRVRAARTRLWVLLAFALVIAAVVWVEVAGADELDDFCCVLWIGDSLRDVVRESEGGQMPSQEEFNRRGGGGDGRSNGSVDAPTTKEGESHPADAGTLPVPEHGPDSTPPRAPDVGGPGRAVPEERRLTAWAFGVWRPDGSLVTGRIFPDADECAVQRGIGKSQYPALSFGPCMEMSHGRETL